jgi:ubiquinone biosynthesis accessory factor UbiJ
MDALETLLKPAARMMNRQIRMKTPARELFGALRGRVVAVRVRNTALAMYFRVDSDEVALLGEFEGVPDVVIIGPLHALARLAGKSGENAVRDGSLELVGDGEVARDFQRLLSFARPDIEEELSGIIGDAAAHSLGNLARGLSRWSRQARSVMQQNLKEYLQEESSALPARYEVETFRHEVETLRDDVARFEARLKRLEDHAAPVGERRD